MSAYRLKGTAGPLINRSFPLTGVLSIGRADDCDIRIDDANVLPRHAIIRVDEVGKVRIEPAAPGADLRVNGATPDGSVLSGGDEIQVGSSRLMLQAPGLRPERVLTEMATRPRHVAWPWLLLMAAFAVAALAWQRGWLAGLL